jgi:hypothetical protein
VVFVLHGPVLAHFAGEFPGRGVFQGLAGDKEALAVGLFSGTDRQGVTPHAQDGGYSGENGSLGFEAYGIGGHGHGDGVAGLGVDEAYEHAELVAQVFAVEGEGARNRQVPVLDVAANPTGAAPGRWRKVMLVIVFVSPGDYHNEPFADEAKWTCFRLMSPDLPEGRDVFAYAEIGSTRETQLRRIILRASQFRQHMTLQIQGSGAPGGERLFEVTRVVELGWVRGERDIEEDW